MVSLNKLTTYTAVSLSLLAVFTCSVWGSLFGYWPHDSWAYTTSEMHEFIGGQRWLAPAFHALLHKFPQYLAWWLSILLYWYFNYSVVRQYLSGATDFSEDVGKTSLILSSVPLLVPSFYVQLCWPTHSLSAILVLVAMSLLSKKLPKAPVVIVGTVVVFAIHQAFAFLTILLLLPRHTELSSYSVQEGAKKATKIVFTWVSAFFISYSVSKVAQYLYFGMFTDVSRWRVRESLTSLSSITDSFFQNRGIFVEHILDMFSLEGVAVLLLAPILLYAFFVKTGRQKPAPLLVLLVVGATVPFVLYLAMSVTGDRFPLRTTFIIGASLLCLALAIYMVGRTLLPVVAFLVLLFSYPLYVTYQNEKWYSNITSQTIGVIHEIKEDKGSSLNGVIIDDSINQNGIFTMIDKSKNVFLSVPKIFPNITFMGKIDSLFYELGYRNVRWCVSNTSFIDPRCREVKDMKTTSKCSTIDPNVCSLGISDKNYWLIRTHSK